MPRQEVAKVSSAEEALSNPNVIAALTLMKGALPEAMVEQMTQLMAGGENQAAVALGGKAPKRELKINTTVDNLFRRYSFVKIALDNGALHYAEIPEESRGDPEFDVQTLPHIGLSDEEFSWLVEEQYLSDWGYVLAKDVDECVKTAKVRIRMRVPKRDNTLFMIADNLYYDAITGEFTDTPSRLCTRRLFDTPEEDASKDILCIPREELDGPFGNLVKQFHKATLAELERYNGDLPESSGALIQPFEFVQAWANGSHDRYMDIMRMFASPFMAKKPDGAYFLIGSGANGKSVAVSLLHTILGTNNTSTVCFADLDEWHANLELANTLLNAPDEELRGALKNEENIKMFKSMSVHMGVRLKVMRAQKRKKIQADFMNIYPMNYAPELPSSGVEAFLRRYMGIAFTNVFQNTEGSSDSFAEKTFTTDALAAFLGVILGIASYHRTHDFILSQTMLEARASLYGTYAPGNRYKQLFIKWFDGYQSMTVLYKDFSLWCKNMRADGEDVKITAQSGFSPLWDEYSERKTVKMPNGSRVKMVQVGRSSGHRWLAYESVHPVLKDNSSVEEYLSHFHIAPSDEPASPNLSVRYFHERGFSLVYLLEKMYQQSLDDALYDDAGETAKLPLDEEE